MQTLNISDAGFMYLFKCIGYYSEGCWYFVLYVAALIFIAVKGEKRIRQIFIPPAVLMLLTVFNPVFPVVLNKIFDVNKEYYRFFWMLPAVIEISYAAALLVSVYAGNKVRKVMLTLIILCIFVASGTYVYKDGYIVSPDIYKMPTEIPEISEIIHKDSDEEFPRAVFEYDYEMQIRQYDASILLPCNRDEYIRAVTGSLTWKEITADENYYNRLLAVVVLGQEPSKEDFLEGLDQTNTEYVVVSNTSPTVSYLKSAGLKAVGNTVNHTVFRYKLKDPKKFELVDYSEVWANQ